MKFNSIFKKNKVGKRLVYELKKEDLYKELKELNTEIINKFNLIIPNRNAIIKSLIQFLSQGSIYSNQADIDSTGERFYVIKTDIANFFPSINKHKLYRKIVKSSLLKDNSLDIIKSFIFNRDVSGVPVGMPFSNALSEVYLEDLDDSIRRKFSPTFYVRYVDDILIIKSYPNGFNVRNHDQNNELFESEKKLLFSLLDEIGLSLNENKTDIYGYDPDTSTLNFDYLGYNFSIANKKLQIDISKKKYDKKILNRLTRYFKSYSSSTHTDKDFWILYYRIKNLIYGTTSSGENGIGHTLKFGICFNYKFINSGIRLRGLLKTFHYFRTKYSNHFTSEQTAHLFSLITVNSESKGRIILNQFSEINDLLLLLKKRLNYTKYSVTKLEEIANKIGCSPIFRSADSLYQYNLQIQIMKQLRIL